jgi:Tetrapyrrole (Corrin/Porphyrin) Methylases
LRKRISLSIPRNKQQKSDGSLTVVGTGIEFATQLTPLARSSIVEAGDVPYLVADPATGTLLHGLNPSSRSLGDFYRHGLHRSDIYEGIIEDILASVRRGHRVCAVFYGHPGIFVHPSHEAIRRARVEGFAAGMLPAISAEACLVADLGVDPGQNGWQSYEATDFVVNQRRIDPSASLVLWQVAALGEIEYPVPPSRPERRAVLAETLREWYPPRHELVIYEASTYAVCPPRITRVSLEELEMTPLPPASTLYVAPVSGPRHNFTAERRIGT